MIILKDYRAVTQKIYEQALDFQFLSEHGYVADGSRVYMRDLLEMATHRKDAEMLAYLHAIETLVKARSVLRARTYRSSLGRVSR